MIDRLREVGVKAIAYDFAFAQRTSAAQDNALIRAAIRTPNLVLAATSVTHKGRPDVLGGTHNVLAGSANFDVSQDRVIRRVKRFDTGMSSFAAATAQLALGHGPDPARFAADGALIDYAGPAETIDTVSFSDVLDGRDADRLRGRIVVVGATDPLLKDIQQTPVGGGMPGPEVQANAIATILRDVPLRDAAGWQAVAAHRARGRRGRSAARVRRGHALLVSDATRAALHDPPADLVSAGTPHLHGAEAPLPVWTLHGDGGPGIVPSPPPSGRP
jgi:adenylate cyclase